VSIVDHHTVGRSTGGYHDTRHKGGQSSHPTYCVLNDYNAWWGTIVRRWDRYPPWIPVANSVMVAYPDPLRGNQQGLGTKLSHAKNCCRPSCSSVWPAQIGRSRTG
jgi:hypothetical protein